MLHYNVLYLYPLTIIWTGRWHRSSNHQQEWSADPLCSASRKTQYRPWCPDSDRCGHWDKTQVTHHQGNKSQEEEIPRPIFLETINQECPADPCHPRRTGGQAPRNNWRCTNSCSFHRKSSCAISQGQKTTRRSPSAGGNHQTKGHL